MIGYISRDKVASTLCAGCAYNCSTVRKETHPCMDLKELMSIQPEDVAPVRHGRWIDGDSLPMHDIAGNLSWGNWYTCNQCEFKTYAIERHITQYNYCPNCGAKMDEGGSNGTDD